LQEEEEVTLNKLLYLCKQGCLLEKHASDFLQHDIKEISELEELDHTEEEDQRKAELQKHKESIEMSLAPSSNNLSDSSSDFMRSLSTDMSFFFLSGSQQIQFDALFRDNSIMLSEHSANAP
jgi:hypothetical protein